MPTRPGFDLVPVRKATKSRLAALKGEGSFDDLIQQLLASAESPPAAPLERPWPAHKQEALADLAAKRWQLALDRGRIEERGPRLIVYRTRTSGRRVPRARLLR